MVRWGRIIFIVSVLAAISLGATDAALWLQAYFGRNPLLAATGPALAVLAVVGFAVRSRRH
jgi:hypothetical protein